MSEKEQCILSQTKIEMEGVEPPSQFPADYFENKVELEFEGKSYPAPAEFDEVLTFAMAIGASCHPKANGSHTVLSLSHTTWANHRKRPLCQCRPN